MKKYISKSLMAMCAVAALGTTSCIEEEFPTTLATPEQVESSSMSLEYMLNGLSNFFLDYNTYGASSVAYIDWGFPCQMMMREVQGEDFPIYSSVWNYWTFLEAGSGLTYGYYYTFYYYYAFIHNANNVIGMVNPDEANTAQLNVLGSALGYRAMCYLDLMRCYEYKKTGFESLDAQAVSDDVYGLGTPIVTENTTLKESQNNPRATVYKMNRFIMTDLNHAEEYIKGYSRASKAHIDLSVIYGLKARLWLDMASRFDFDSEELAKQMALEGSDDGYDDLGITTALECYKKAQDYAVLAQAGYSPLTKDQWLNAEDGFNNADSQSSWILGTKCTTIEQITNRYYNFQGQMCSEATWAMPQYGKAYRCISTALFNQISDQDWRKLSWIAPADADMTTLPDKYATLTRGLSGFKALPAYTNIKFHPGGGLSGLTESTQGLLADLPIMRVEEMKFIELECMAHTQSVSAAAYALQTFINTYRYNDGSYVCSCNDMDSFIDALMLQRRIEFWGEGINYFDYKRLHRAITRTYSGTNHLSTFRLNSKEGYVAPWMNYVLPEGEQDQNKAITSLNPDPTGVVTAE
jgi:hypothetical protein